MEGYTRFSLHDLEKKYHLAEDATGNVIIHTVEGEQQLFDAITQAPAAVIAADLAFTLDTRERNAGLNALRKLIDEFNET